MSDRPNAILLDKKAVKAALDQKWKAAINLNLELLDLKPNDKKANMRLGRAYLQTNDFKKAEKIFRSVLKSDPINPIAKRNLELAKSKKKVNFNGNHQGIIEEPGMTAKEYVELTAKNLQASDFEPREKLDIKINKASVSILRKGRTVGKVITPDLVKRLNAAKSKRGQITVYALNGKNNVIRVLFRSNVRVFKAEKQDLKPYMKKGTIDEPEVEMAATEDTK